MKPTILIVIFCFIAVSLWGQEAMHIEGAIVMEESQDTTPEAGTIRWTGTDFEGYDGFRWVSLTSQNMGPSVTDIDGNVYKTIAIGGTYWMAENLKTTKFKDGTAIAQLPYNSSWQNTSGPGYSYFNNYPANWEKFGLLYNGYTLANDKICPVGWKVPNHILLRGLLMQVASSIDPGPVHYEFIGFDDLRSRDNGNWGSNLYAGNDLYGFDARGSGWRSPAGYFAEHLNGFSIWGKHSQTIYSMVYTSLPDGDIRIHNNIQNLNQGLSIRCVMDQNRINK